MMTYSFSVSNDAAGPLKVVQGEFEIGSQYHFHLEPHSCLVRPLEDGQYEVISATQTVYKVQATVAKALAMPENAFDLRYVLSDYVQYPAKWRVLGCVNSTPRPEGARKRDHAT